MSFQKKRENIAAKKKKKLTPAIYLDFSRNFAGVARNSRKMPENNVFLYYFAEIADFMLFFWLIDMNLVGLMD